MKKIMFILATALVMAACSNDEPAPQDEVQYVSELKVAFTKGDTRVTAEHSSAGLTFEWDEDDIIGIIATDGSSKLLYIYDSETESFKPRYPYPGMEAGKEYFATRMHLNPTLTPDTKIIDGKVAAVMKVCSDMGDGFIGIPMISDPFVADPNGTVATMHHLTGVMEVPLKLAAGSDPKTIIFELYSSDDIPLPYFDAIPEEPYLQNVEVRWYSSQYVTGTYTLNADTYTSVFVPLTPGHYPSLKLRKMNTSNALHTFNDITIQRGKITKVTPIVIDPS